MHIVWTRWSNNPLEVCILGALKKYLQEYETIIDLLKQGAEYVYCISIGDEYIYFTSQMMYPEMILLSFYRSKEEYSGWISSSPEGDILTSPSPKGGYIPVINLKYSTVVRECLAEKGGIT